MADQTLDPTPESIIAVITRPIAISFPPPITAVLLYPIAAAVPAPEIGQIYP